MYHIMRITNWFPSSNDYRVEYKVQVGMESSNTYFFFGGRSSTDKNGIAVAIVSGKLREDYCNSGSYTESTVASANQIIERTMNYNGTDFSSSAHAVVFSVNTNGTIDDRMEEQQVFYYIRTYDSAGNLTHNFVAGVNNGNIGICDLVTYEWFYPATGNELLTYTD